MVLEPTATRFVVFLVYRLAGDYCSLSCLGEIRCGHSMSRGEHAPCCFSCSEILALPRFCPRSCCPQRWGKHCLVGSFSAYLLLRAASPFLWLSTPPLHSSLVPEAEAVVSPLAPERPFCLHGHFGATTRVDPAAEVGGWSAPEDDHSVGLVSEAEAGVL